MKRYEYQVVPAPKKGEKAKGAKTAADRFAVALTSAMNKMAAEGWDYLRTDTLPCEERVGLTGSKNVFQNMLVFRREILAEAVQMLGPAIPRAKVEPPKSEHRQEPKLSSIPTELFSDAEPDEVEPMKELPKPAKTGTD